MLCLAISYHEEAGVLHAMVSFLHPDVLLLSSLPIRLPGLRHSPHWATLVSEGTAPPAAAGASHVPTPELFLRGPAQFLTPPAELGKQSAETGQDEAQWGEAGSDTATTWDGVGWGGWQPTGHKAGQSRDVINPEYGHRLGWQGAAGRGFWVEASGEASQGKCSCHPQHWSSCFISDLKYQNLSYHPLLLSPSLWHLSAPWWAQGNISLARLALLMVYHHESQKWFTLTSPILCLEKPSCLIVSQLPAFQKEASPFSALCSSWSFLT